MTRKCFRLCGINLGCCSNYLLTIKQAFCNVDLIEIRPAKNNGLTISRLCLIPLIGISVAVA